MATRSTGARPRSGCCRWAVARRRQLTRLPEDVEEFAWSPDGAGCVSIVVRHARLAGSAGDATPAQHRPGTPGSSTGCSTSSTAPASPIDRPPNLWVVDVADGSARRLTSGTARDGQPAWSPDGTPHRVRLRPPSGAGPHLAHRRVSRRRRWRARHAGSRAVAATARSASRPGVRMAASSPPSATGSRPATRRPTACGCSRRRPSRPASDLTVGQRPRARRGAQLRPRGRPRPGHHLERRTAPGSSSRHPSMGRTSCGESAAPDGRVDQLTSGRARHHPAPWRRASATGCASPSVVGDGTRPWDVAIVDVPARAPSRPTVLAVHRVTDLNAAMRGPRSCPWPR